MNRFIHFLTLMIISTLIASCVHTEKQKPSRSGEKTASKESLVVANKYLTRTEDEEIERYINRHQLDVTATGTGLRYVVTRSGKGSKPVKGDQVMLEYKTRLITGDVVYSSADSGPMEFKVGKGGVPSGLEEGILQLNLGDEAVIILPSHLAFGLLGDQNKIPARATVIYEIKFIKLRKNQ